MSKDLIRIRSSLLDTPHLIDEQSYRAIQDYFESREAGELTLKDDDKLSLPETFTYNADTKTAIVRIEGPLTNRSTPIQALCGGASYTKLKADFTQLIDGGAKTIAMEIRSGGGEAVGCFSAAKYVKKLAVDNGVKLLAYTDDRACSAAYAWAVIADEFIVADDATIGSIGVLVQISNDLKKRNQEGIETIFVTAGKSKVPFNKDGSFSEESLKDIQDKVNKTYTTFVGHVVEMTGLSEEAVKATEAKTFMGDDAVALGLADKVMSYEEFQDYLADVAQGSAKEVAKIIGTSSYKLTLEETLQMEELQKLQAAHEELTTLMAGKETEMLALSEKLAEMTAAVTEKETALAEAMAKVASMEAEMQKTQKEAKLASRTAQLAEVMQKEQAAETAASLEALADDAFATVLAGFQRQYSAMQGSDLFKQMSAPEASQEASTPVQTEAKSELHDDIKAKTLAAMKAR